MATLHNPVICSGWDSLKPATVSLVQVCVDAGQKFSATTEMYELSHVGDQTDVQIPQSTRGFGLSEDFASSTTGLK